MAGQGVIGALVPQGTRYPFSSEIGAFVIGYSPIGVVPEVVVALPKVTPAYVYKQYDDDDDVLAFNEAFNETAQQYLDWFNNLDLPIYTGLTGAMLDWVAGGPLYGYLRPVLRTGFDRLIGPYGTFSFGVLSFGSAIVLARTIFIAVSDDVYKRCLTWHFFKGDGKYFTSRWLKRRVARFLTGQDGTSPLIGPTPGIMVTTGPSHISIRLVTTRTVIVTSCTLGTFAFGTQAFGACLKQSTSVGPKYDMAEILKQAVEEGALEMPFQYTADVITEASYTPVPGGIS